MEFPKSGQGARSCSQNSQKQGARAEIHARAQSCVSDKYKKS